MVQWMWLQSRKWGGGGEAKKLNSNREGKGIGAGDCNSDVRSREITVMNVMVGLHLWGEKEETETEINGGGRGEFLKNYAGWHGDEGRKKSPCEWTGKEFASGQSGVGQRNKEGGLRRSREEQGCVCCWWNVDGVCLRVSVCVCVHWRPQVRTEIMTSFLFSFAETLSSTPLYSSSPLSVSSSLSPPPSRLLILPPLCRKKPEVTPSSKQTGTHTKGRNGGVTCVSAKCVRVCLSQGNTHAHRMETEVTDLNRRRFFY